MGSERRAPLMISVTWLYPRCLLRVFESGIGMMMYSSRIFFARYAASTSESSVFACAWLWNLSKCTALRTRVLL